MAASFAAASFLCGDISLRNLLGVRDHKEDHILITCKDVVKHYNILDRKQLKSWTTKSWHPFTCPAVHNPASGSIVATINTTALAQWGYHEEDIDKVKRQRFETPIHQLLASEENVYVLFVTGKVEELSSALKSRKETKTGVLNAEESIKYVQIITEARVVVMLVETGNGLLKLWKLPLTESFSSPSDCGPLILKGSTLTGICALSSSKLITLWSTGELYSCNLEQDYLERLPGRRHATEKQIVAAKPAKILELSPSHIAIIGQDRGDEGGLLVLRDIKFGMTTSTCKLKMCHVPPLAWLTQGGVVVGEGSSLALVPYTVQESNLAAVLGTKISETKGLPSEVCHSWAKNSKDPEEQVPREASKTMYGNKNSQLSQLMEEFDRGALSESIIVVEIVKQLIEKKKLKLLYDAMDSFKNVPEATLIDTLNFYLNCKDKEFANLCDHPTLPMEFQPVEDDADKLVCPYSSAKAHFINGVLKKPFTDNQLLLELPKISFDSALSLIQYLNFFIASGEVDQLSGREVVSMKQLCQWLSLLLDTHYHQLVMSSQVTIHQLLLSCFTHITNMRKFLEGMVDMEPLVQRVLEAKTLSKQTPEVSAVYSLERLVI